MSAEPQQELQRLESNMSAGNDTYGSRKVFLGGLRFAETEESVEQHFSQFGTIETVLIPRDKATGKPRGFGFVTFKEVGVATELASNPQHNFNGRNLDIKIAVPRPSDFSKSAFPTDTTADNKGVSSSGDYHFQGMEEEEEDLDGLNKTNHGSIDGISKQTNVEANRIFVGGLPDGVTNQSLKDYFAKFGSVTDSFVLLHPQTRRPRGFGFVTFEDVGVVSTVLDCPKHIINGKRVETRLATVRSSKNFDAPSKFTQYPANMPIPPYGPSTKLPYTNSSLSLMSNNSATNVTNSQFPAFFPMHMGQMQQVNSIPPMMYQYYQQANTPGSPPNGMEKTMGAHRPSIHQPGFNPMYFSAAFYGQAHLQYPPTHQSPLPQQDVPNFSSRPMDNLHIGSGNNAKAVDNLEATMSSLNMGQH